MEMSCILLMAWYMREYIYILNSSMLNIFNYIIIYTEVYTFSVFIYVLIGLFTVYILVKFPITSLFNIRRGIEKKLRCVSNPRAKISLRIGCCSDVLLFFLLDIQSYAIIDSFILIFFNIFLMYFLRLIVDTLFKKLIFKKIITVSKSVFAPLLGNLGNPNNNEKEPWYKRLWKRIKKFYTQHRIMIHVVLGLVLGLGLVSGTYYYFEFITRFLNQNRVPGSIYSSQDEAVHVRVYIAIENYLKINPEVYSQTLNKTFLEKCGITYEDYCIVIKSLLKLELDCINLIKVLVFINGIDVWVLNQNLQTLIQDIHQLRLNLEQIDSIDLQAPMITFDAFLKFMDSLSKIKRSLNSCRVRLNYILSFYPKRRNETY
jgi:hypothetical protein